MNEEINGNSEIIISDNENDDEQNLKDKYKSFDFAGNIVNLSDQQQKIVMAPINQHMKIIACAGSGKTTTIICRAKYLLDKGVSPNKIIITTFNVEAGHNIQNKLSQLVGAQAASELLIGNIDKIAYSFYVRFFKKPYYVGVREYCKYLLDFLKKKDGQKITTFYKYFFFDEFQDISAVQYEILLQFYKSGCKINVIGDDAQTIYSWRGSKIDRIQNEVDKDIEGIKSYYLSINYRSTPEIIQFSNQIIIHSSELIKKEMNYQIQQQQTANVSQSDQNKMNEEIELLQSKKPYIQSYKSLYEQNNKILKRVVSLIKNQGIKPNQIAILSPYNKPLKYLEELFEKHNSINPPHNQIQYIPLITQQDYIVQKSKQRQIRNDILDIAVEINQQVVLSTIHKSKGLEWDFVFVIGCNDDFFPGMQTKEKVEEHRRLFYVASTRAAKNLYFNFVNNQKFFRISRFFTEMMNIQNIKLYFEFDENEIPGQCFSLPQGIEEIKPPFLTVSGEILQILDDFQYYKMRQEQIFPEIQDQVIHIHQHFNYSDQILEKQLMQDFQNFLLVYFQRKISEKFHTPAGYQNLSANSVLYTMSLSINYYQTYEKYQKIIVKKIMEKQITQQTKHKELPHIFKEYFPECFKMEEEEIIQSSYDDIVQNSQPNNIQHLQQNELNQSDCSISNILKYVNDEASEQLQIQNIQNQNELNQTQNQTQNQNDQNLNQNNSTNKQKIIFTPELQELMEIIEAIQTVADLNKIPIEQVQVSDQQYFPEDYDYSEFISEYQIFKDPKNQTKDIIRSIYQISLLQQIFEKRRRLLYIDAFNIFYSNQYQQMIEQCINQYFLQDTIIEKNPQFVENNIYIQNNEYQIEGTIDLIVDDIAYFFRSSNSKKPSIEQVLSALVTISIYQIENEQQHLENINRKRTHSKQESHEINYIVFYNCMQGTLVKFDISVFDQQYQLLQHLKKYRDIYCKADNLDLIQDQQMKFQLLDNDIIQKNIQKLQENGQIQKIQQQNINNKQNNLIDETQFKSAKKQQQIQKQNCQVSQNYKGKVNIISLDE